MDNDTLHVQTQKFNIMTSSTGTYTINPDPIFIDSGLVILSYHYDYLNGGGCTMYHVAYNFYKINDGKHNETIDVNLSGTTHAPVINITNATSNKLVTLSMLSLKWNYTI